MMGTGVSRGKASRIGMALLLALLTVFSVLSPIPFNQSIAVRPFLRSRWTRQPTSQI